MSNGPYGPQAPKPYEFVSVSEVRREDREHPAGHHRYDDDRISGHLDATLVVVTPLHVGAGTLRMTGDDNIPLVRSHVTANDRAAVPASTMKGMIRSTFEAITRSCLRITRARRHELPQGTNGCRDKKNLCVACRVFGALGYQGLVRVSDAVLREEHDTRVTWMPSLYAPRRRADVYKEGGTVAGRKFYKHGKTVTDGNVPVEVCLPGSRLDFRLDFDNLRPAEVGVLLRAMGLGDPDFFLKVGGGKPACYGSVMVEIDRFQTWAGPAALYSSYDAEEATSGIETYLEQAHSLIEEEQLDELLEIAEWTPDRECPEGNY